jgi:protein TonB
MILVAVDGTPKDIKVESSSGFRELDQAAIETARKWRFNPQVKNGQKVEAFVRVPVNFNLNQL